jgi:hypothetical protein
VGTYTPQALVVRAEGFLWDFLWVFFGRGWGAAEVDIEAGAVLGRSGVGKVGIDSLGEVIKSSHALRGLLFCRFGESDLTLVCLFVCLFGCFSIGSGAVMVIIITSCTALLALLRLAPLEHFISNFECCCCSYCHSHQHFTGDFGCSPINPPGSDSGSDSDPVDGYV